MRLICPNCDAEYSVDDGAIPEGGRDVQCSNCGHGWFQMHPEAEESAEAEAALFGTPDPFPARMSPPAPDAALPRAMATLIAAVPEPDDDEVTPVPPLSDAPRRTLDDNLLAVLREEAARETAERRAEAPQMPELQPELGLTEAARVPAPDPEPVETGSVGDRPAPRRDLLPDIEEINSTLRTGSDPRMGAEEAAAALVAQKKRGGFRAGFAAMLLVAGLLVATYSMAPRIAAYLPGAAPAMARYVETVDSARLWLDGVMQKAAGMLRGVSGEAG